MADPAQKPTKRKATGVEGGPGAKRFRPSFNNTITVLVGEEQEPFIVHIDTICQRSDFFVAACKREWLEGQDKTVPLPEIQPKIFTLYANWAYSGVLDVEIVDDPDAAQACLQEADGDDDVQHERKEALWGHRQSSIIALYIAADFLCDGALKDRAVDGLLDTMEKSGSFYMKPALISKVWKSTATSSGLRRVILDRLISSYKGCDYIKKSRGNDTIPAEFFVDVAERLLFLHGPLRAVKPTPSRRDHYYDSSSPHESAASDQALPMANAYGNLSAGVRMPYPGRQWVNPARYKTLEDVEDPRTRKYIQEMQMIVPESVQRCFDALVKKHGNKEGAIAWLTENGES
ncbi:hypothetical protein LTR17_007453 [Elasticomyces elasticus]|nr:hypothetical protein LTR17_007453 [Elasticomyces elasticus]